MDEHTDRWTNGQGYIDSVVNADEECIYLHIWFCHFFLTAYVSVIVYYLFSVVSCHFTLDQKRSELGLYLFVWQQFQYGAHKEHFRRILLYYFCKGKM